VAQRRFLLILITVSAIALIAFVVMSVRTWAENPGHRVARQGDAPSANGQATSVVLSLEEAETIAGEHVSLWASDAVLLRADLIWQPAAMLDGYDARLAGDWSFYYYSPAEESVMVVAVNNGVAFPAPAIEVRYSPTPLGSFPPPQDAVEAWRRFRAEGGGAFLNDNPDATMRLSLLNRDGVIWAGRAYTPEAGFELHLDANSGAVVEKGDL
jgi:hypothetical protein